jgi:hypothetical protein
MMRLGTVSFLLLSALLSLLLVGVSQAVIPIRRYDAHGTVAKVTPATDAEKKAGVLLTLVLQDSDRVIQVTRETDLHRQTGKLVPKAAPGDLEKGQRVSVWLLGKSDKAEAVLIFP